MLPFIEKLKAKPVYVRKRIALLSTIAIFSIIAGIWWHTWTIPTSTSSASFTQTPIEVVSDFAAKSKETSKEVLTDLIKENAKKMATGTSEWDSSLVKEESFPDLNNVPIDQTANSASSAPIVDL